MDPQVDSMLAHFKKRGPRDQSLPAALAKSQNPIARAEKKVNARKSTVLSHSVGLSVGQSVGRSVSWRLLPSLYDS